MLNEITDAVAHVREHRAMYFRTATALVAGLVEEALILGCREVRAVAGTDYWLVMGDEDWMIGAQLPIHALFRRVVSLPQAGPNSMRSEVVVNAFCASVATWTRTEGLVIAGSPEGWPAIWGEVRAQHDSMNRFVAFSAPE